MAGSSTGVPWRLTLAMVTLVGIVSEASAAALSGAANTTANTTIIEREPAPRFLAARASEPTVAALDGNGRLLSVTPIEAAPATSRAPIVFAYN